MSGGELVIIDRAGRAGKRYPLLDGLATIGSGPACDIRVLQAAVEPHHATIVVRNNQTVIRAVSDAVTLVNARAVSVAALRHGDLISVGSRSLRWEYANPDLLLPSSSPPVYVRTRKAGAGTGAGSGRAGSAGPAGGAGAGERDRGLELAIEMSRRASMPAGITGGGKQVAIVQPQRRAVDTPTDSNPRLVVKSHRPFVPTYKRQRMHSQSQSDSNNSRRKSNARKNSNSAQKSLQNTTKATLWIESRKCSPRRSVKLKSLGQGRTPVARASDRRNTSLRMAVLRKSMTPGPSRAPLVTKIQAPLKIDHTKQAAIMLMTGAARRTLDAAAHSGSESEVLNASRKGSRSLRCRTASPRVASTLPEPKKSALKQPDSKNVSRKTESITFDLSNLEDNSTLNGSVEHLLLSDTSKAQSLRSARDSCDTHLLHHSDILNRKSLSGKLQSRSGRILEKSIGTAMNLTQSLYQHTSAPVSPRSRKSMRGNVILQKALETSTSSRTRYTNSLSARSGDDASSYKTRNTNSKKKLETYSIVDLVSVETNDSDETCSSSGKSYSVYNSADSSAGTYETPRDGRARNTRTSDIDLNLVATSTPYVRRVRQSQRSRSSTTVSDNTSINNKDSKLGTRDLTKRRSKSLTTPENNQEIIPVISARASRASKSRSRINESDLLFISSQLDEDNEDTSPVTSRRGKAGVTVDDQTGTINSSVSSVVSSPGRSPTKPGTITPNNNRSPVSIGTPKLSIQHLLNSSRNSALKDKKNMSSPRRSTRGQNTVSAPNESRSGGAESSKSLSVRRTLLRRSKDSEGSDKTVEGAPQKEDAESVTPTSSVLPLPEPVKNKHSTAKKTQSKRSLIDNLDHSEIVKQLFNSPVKRKLSQSMMEFSKRHFDDAPRKRTRNTVAVVRRTPNQSLQNVSEAITPDVFVSPIGTPNKSPDLDGIKRLFDKNSPDNDLSDLRGVRYLLRTPGKMQSAKNDLTDVFGVKQMFGKSPKNRLSDVRGVKNLYKRPPKNDLGKVSGVKALFQSDKKRNSPRNDLSDVSGVKGLFREPNSPKNDLSDVRGVRGLFRREGRDELSDVSGVERLFDEWAAARRDSDALFDQLVGKPTIKAVYSKSLTKSSRKPLARQTKSLHVSIDTDPDKVDRWLREELQKRNDNKRLLNNSSKLERELKKLNTNTVAGASTPPVSQSRRRSSTIKRLNVSGRKKMPSEVYSARRLPIKKRSVTEASLEQSNDSHIKSLPLKKRMIIHSTPLKAQFSVTANASQLGRVSPITSIDFTRDVNTTDRVGQHLEIRNKSKKVGQATIEKLVAGSVKVSPIKTRGKRAQSETVVSVVPSRATRIRKLAEEKIEPKNKKNRKQNTPDKKTTALSPKIALPKSRRTRKQAQAVLAPVEHKQSPKKLVTRAKISQVNAPEKLKSPKKTRAKVRRSSVVIGKPTPQLKPRRRGLQNIDTNFNEVNNDSKNQNRTNKRTIKHTEPVKRQKIANTAPVGSAQPRPKRGQTLQIDTKQKTRTRKTELTFESPRVRSGKAKTDVFIKVPATKVGKGKSKTEEIVSSSAPKVGRGKAKTEEIVSSSAPKVGRGKAKTEEIVSSSAPKVGRGKAKTEEIVSSSAPKVGRGKAKTEEIVSSSAPKVGRGKAKTEETVSSSAPKVGIGKAKTEETVSSSAPKVGRGKAKTEEIVSSSAPKVGRGKAKTEEIVSSSAPKVGRGKAKTEEIVQALAPKIGKGKAKIKVIAKSPTLKVRRGKAKTKVPVKSPPKRAGKGKTKIDDRITENKHPNATEKTTEATTNRTVRKTRRNVEALTVTEETGRGRKRNEARGPEPSDVETKTKRATRKPAEEPQPARAAATRKQKSKESGAPPAAARKRRADPQDPQPEGPPPARVKRAAPAARAARAAPAARAGASRRGRS